MLGVDSNKLRETAKLLGLTNKVGKNYVYTEDDVIKLRELIQK
jgi:hypothetical protein